MLYEYLLIAFHVPYFYVLWGLWLRGEDKVLETYFFESMLTASVYFSEIHCMHCLVMGNLNLSVFLLMSNKINFKEMPVNRVIYTRH